ncbi:hypothetical protein LCGC14_1794050 [marine sediment metagenome]|uniref:Uncharacterized protein n=1 Tax=marine sediment metagenome TaxID=412755 RepID=A0A0F9GRM9_9ZZZZ
MDDGVPVPMHNKLVEFGHSHNMSFFDSEQKECGVLSWEGGVFRFKGNTEESAKVFFKLVALLSVNIGKEE